MMVLSLPANQIICQIARHAGRYQREPKPKSKPANCISKGYKSTSHFGRKLAKNAIHKIARIRRQ